VSTPTTTSKSSRRDLTGALPRHLTKELFIAQCQSVPVSSSAIGEITFCDHECLAVGRDCY
jgi:hypothetical protein